MPDKLRFPPAYDPWILLGFWCAAIALVNPLGDFPLNDDWAYGQNTRALAVDNRLFFSDWPAMTLIAHTVWGALFAKIFGFSFTVLRFSNLLLGASGILAFYRLLQWSGASRRMTWFAVLVLAFNPLWLVLANSYMTDVPFVSVLLWSVFFFLRVLEQPAPRWLATATFFALWACLIRQLGLLVPGVFFLLSLYYRPFSIRNVVSALLPFALCFAGVTLFTEWLRATGQLPDSFTGLDHLVRNVRENPKIWSAMVERSGLTLLTVGLFLLPVSVSAIRSRPALRQYGVWVLPALGAWCMWLARDQFPQGNVFYNLGLGPKLLKDAFWNPDAGPQLPGPAFTVVTLAAAAGAGLLLLSLSPRHSAVLRNSMIRSFSLWFCAVYLFFIGANWLLIDRYLLVFVPFLLLFLATVYREYTKAGIALLGLLSLFSVAATHDYLAWNRARWQVLGQLHDRGATPLRTDGGFEYNGWNNAVPTSQRVPGLKSWWFVRDDEWVVSFDPLEGYIPETVAEWPRWLPPGTDTVLASRRIPYTAIDSVWCSMEQISPDSTVFLPEAGTLQPGNGHTRSAERARSGQFSAKLGAGREYGATLALRAFQPNDRVLVSVWKYPAIPEGGIVVTSEDASNCYFFEPSYLVQRDSAGWGLTEFSVPIPRAVAGKKGSVYLWNPSDRAVWFDDLKIYHFRTR